MIYACLVAYRARRPGPMQTFASVIAAVHVDTVRVCSMIAERGSEDV